MVKNPIIKIEIFIDETGSYSVRGSSHPDHHVDKEFFESICGEFNKQMRENPVINNSMYLLGFELDKESMH